MLRLGPYGDGFGVRPDGLSLAKVLAHPHGIDLGPLRPRLPQPLKTRSGKIELLPQPIADDLPRLREALRERPAGIVLIGRRHLRSNNSWMHNVPALTGGTNRCTLHIHPEDAARLGVLDGAPVRIKGAGGEVVAPAEITDVVRRGVVSLPARLGTRPARHPARARRRRPRCQRQPAPRRQSAGPAVGQCRTQWCTHRTRASRHNAVTWSFALIARTSTSC